MAKEALSRKRTYIVTEHTRLTDKEAITHIKNTLQKETHATYGYISVTEVKSGARVKQALKIARKRVRQMEGKT